MMKPTAAVLPQHIAIIPDGNRRWAKSHHLSTFQGHKRGVEVFEAIGDAAIERGVKYLTFWGFSTENWKRPRPEVSYLMKLFRWVFTKKLDDFHRKGIRLNVLGRIDGFSKDLQRLVYRATSKTKNNDRGVLNLALNYGGRAEIVDMIRRALKSGLAPRLVTETSAQQLLYNPDLPDVDLLIRTSGEERLSGFLPWESVYSELYFSKKYWPDFTSQDLDDALAEYSKRQRRFGK